MANKMKNASPGSNMIMENHSAPGNCPQDWVNKEYAKTNSVFQMVNDSIQESDRIMNNRVSQANKQLLKGKY